MSALLTLRIAMFTSLFLLQVLKDVKEISLKTFVLSSERLSLHPKKIYLQECDRGIRFLGTYVTPYFTAVDKRTVARSQVFWCDQVGDIENPYQLRAMEAGLLNSVNAQLRHRRF